MPNKLPEHTFFATDPIPQIAEAVHQWIDEGGNPNIDVLWGDIKMPLLWAGLSLIYRRYDSDLDNEYSDVKLENKQHVIKIIHKLLNKGAVWLPEAVKKQLQDTHNRLPWLEVETNNTLEMLRQHMGADETFKTRSLFEMWMYSVGGKQEKKNKPNPHLALSILDDAITTNSWLEEAIEFGEQISPGRGGVTLLEHIRGALRLGDNKNPEALLKTLHHAQSYLGEKWILAPICGKDWHQTLGAEMAGVISVPIANVLSKELPVLFDNDNGQDLFGYDYIRKLWNASNYLTKHKYERNQTKDQEFVDVVNIALNEIAQQQKQRGNWFGDQFGSMVIPEDQRVVLISWVRQLFRNEDGNRPNLTIGILNCLESTCGLDLAMPPNSIQDEGATLLPAGWQETKLGAAWKRQKLEKYLTQEAIGNSRNPKPGF